MEKSKRVTLPLILGLLFALAVGTIASQATPSSVNSGQHFLPPYENARDRFGFDCGPLSDYDVSLLNAGWYSNWSANLDPPHPDQLTYVQLISFDAGSDPHDPAQVTVRPNKTRIAQIAAAHPGSLWLMNNEPDSTYQGTPIYPDVYAVVYHDFYQYIKGLDPSALIANGGIVQPTPCRLTYLDIVLDTYYETYSETMPVDVWNIHAFILNEVQGGTGASTPPGVDINCAMRYTEEQADDLDIFWDNIKAMRAWMKDKGYQDKPLIISEYGILWPEWWRPQFTPQRVSQFMVDTFDLFLNETDLEIGYPADDYRLVQLWSWYSLTDTYYNGNLFDIDKTLSVMGQTYANYTAALNDVLRADLSVHLVADWPIFSPTLVEPLTFTASLTGSIGNLGKLPASDVLARFETLSDGNGTIVLGHDEFYTVPARFDGVIALPALTATLTAPGRHELRLSLDPEDQIDELRQWNNVTTVTLDLRPDLSPLSLAYRPIDSTPQGGTLALTVTLGNQGSWGSPAANVSIYIETATGGTLTAFQSLPAPPLTVGEQVSLATTVPLSLGLYTLRVIADPDNAIAESDEGNNLITATLGMWPDLLLTDLDYQLSLHPGTLGLTANLAFTSAVRNQGLLSSQAASATIYLEMIPQETAVVSTSLPLPPISTGDPFSLTSSLTWPLLDHDLYRLRIALDEERRLPEQNVSNNQGTWQIAIPVRVSLVPTATMVLTNVRGDVRLVFPEGSVVAPVDVVYTPFWPADQVTGTLSPSALAFSLTAVGGEPLTLTQAVTVTWRYDDAGTIGLTAEHLRLFVQDQDGDWQDAACQPYRRDLNQVTVSICQTGKFVFGNRYDCYLPLLSRDSLAVVQDSDKINMPPR